MPIQFSCSEAEQSLIDRIVQRYINLLIEYTDLEIGTGDKLTLEMDIKAVHCNSCPLDLQRLLDAPESSFGHDVGGIQRYLDRDTGELTKDFRPRCAAAVTA